MPRFPYQPLCVQAGRLAMAAGVPAPDAAILAESLVDADLRGVGTHGLSRLPVYMRRMAKGLIVPDAACRIQQGRPSTLLVDAANGLGQVQAVKTLRAMEQPARENGLATAAIRHSSHFGALSYYCNLAADRGFVLLAVTNCEPSMAPEGGSAPFFGTNPIAASFPTGKGFHLRIDLATSRVARGNIIAAHRRGEEIPQGWALDQSGEPTTDPEAALAGSVLAMAGHKGYALAFLVEVLAGVLAGAAVGPEIGSMYAGPEKPQNVGHFFILLDLAAFMSPTLFRQRLDAMIDAIKAGPKRPGVEEILVPGERSHRRAQENMRLGVPLDETTVRELRHCCSEYGVAWELQEQ